MKLLTLGTSSTRRFLLTLGLGLADVRAGLACVSTFARDASVGALACSAQMTTAAFAATVTALSAKASVAARARTATVTVSTLEC